MGTREPTSTSPSFPSDPFEVSGLPPPGASKLSGFFGLGSAAAASTLTGAFDTFFGRPDEDEPDDPVAEWDDLWRLASRCLPELPDPPDLALDLPEVDGAADGSRYARTEHTTSMAPAPLMEMTPFRLAVTTVPSRRIICTRCWLHKSWEKKAGRAQQTIGKLVMRKQHVNETKPRAILHSQEPWFTRGRGRMVRG